MAVPRKNLFYRSEIVPLLKSTDKDWYYTTYLTGQSGQQDILLILEEVNAYSHQAYSDTKLIKLLPRNARISTRDGLATFMYYFELYLRQGRLHHISDYKKIKGNENYLNLIKTMWENAEDALLKSARYRNLGLYDRYKLKQVYKPENLQEIKSFFVGTAV